MTSILILGSYTALTGCTAVTVKPISADNRVEHICIQQNPRVTVKDFVPVMQEGFNKHGISSQLVTGSLPAGCEFSATYTALRSWDFATYLSEAQIDIQRDGREIASANYHLRAKGGLTLTKFADTRSKILPVIDELLAQIARPDHVTRPPAAAVVTSPAPDSTASKPSGALSEKLASLKDAHDAGLITKEEYESKRSALISEL